MTTNDENKEMMYYIKDNDKRIETLEIVLRELLLVFNDNYFYNKEWYEQLLAKLSGETEKKEDKIFTINELMERIINSEVVLWKFFKMKYDLAKKYGNGDIYKFYGELLTSLEVEKQDLGGEKEGSRVEVPNKKKGKIPQIELDNSKPPDIPLEPELEFGGKNVIKMPTDFNSNPLKPKFSYNSNYKTSEPFSEKPPELHFCKNCGNEISDIEDYVQNLNEPREDDVINLGDLLREKGILPQKADLIIVDFDKDYIIVKREDLQWLFNWTPVEEDDLRYEYNQNDEEVKEYYQNRKRIKEEYKI